jgi:hypothetical protein
MKSHAFVCKSRAEKLSIKMFGVVYLNECCMEKFAGGQEKCPYSLSISMKNETLPIYFKAAKF